MSSSHLIGLDLEKEIVHGIRVSQLANSLCRTIDLEPDLRYELSIAGILHDIGKVEMAPYVYEKKDTMIVEEMSYIRLHPKIGKMVLEQKGYSDLVLDSIYHHHENFDGSGYPEHLSGEEIPLGGRILRICDVYAALTSERMYRKAYNKDTAVRLMIEEVKNFDMRLFLAFMEMIHGDAKEI